ncbi:MAG: dihydrofolate reductase family protein [Parcubacteria group bacterium]
MRKIIVLEFITIDGVMQAPGGPEEDTSGGFKFGGWTVPYFDDFSGKVMSGQMSQPFELLLGRKTFEIFAAYWPQHEAEWLGVNDVKKYAVSDAPENHSWKNSIFLKGDVVQELKKLKRESGPDLHVYGSGKLVQTLMENDLVDEFWLKIFPITLGQGKRLFAEGTVPAAFKLARSSVSPSGVIFADYERAGEVKTGSF